MAEKLIEAFNRMNIDDDEEEPFQRPDSLESAVGNYDKLSLMCKVTHRATQNTSSLIAVLPRIWGIKGRVWGRDLGDGKVRFIFEQEYDLEQVQRKGPWYFDNWYIVLKRWTEDFDDAMLDSLYLWVQIKGIPFRHVSREIVSSVAGELGTVMEVDFSQVEYIRVLVEHKVEQPLVRTTTFKFSDQERFQLTMRYEKLKNFCSNCGSLTHLIHECHLEKKDKQVPKLQNPELGKHLQTVSGYRQAFQPWIERTNIVDEQKETFRLPDALKSATGKFNQLCLIGKVTHRTAQSTTSLIALLPSIWGNHGRVWGRDLGDGKVRFIFEQESDLEQVENRRPWYFDDWYIVLKRWTKDFDDAMLDSLDLWVQIKGIPLQYLSHEMVSFIAGTLGRVVEVDFDPEITVSIEYIRVMVEYKVAQPLVHTRTFEFSDQEKFQVTFRYEKLKSFCHYCGSLTHLKHECCLLREDKQLRIVRNCGLGEHLQADSGYRQAFQYNRQWGTNSNSWRMESDNENRNNRTQNAITDGRNERAAEDTEKLPKWKDTEIFTPMDCEELTKCTTAARVQWNDIWRKKSNQEVIFKTPAPTIRHGFVKNGKDIDLASNGGSYSYKSNHYQPKRNKQGLVSSVKPQLQTSGIKTMRSKRIVLNQLWRAKSNFEQGSELHETIMGKRMDMDIDQILGPEKRSEGKQKKGRWLSKN